MFINTLHSSALDIEYLDTPDFGWQNYRYISDVFRLAHIERYSDNKIEVLHITTFPHQWSPEPIFGFDVIATKENVIGVYMDFSPIIHVYEFDDGFDFKERKPTPEWATVFSNQFICLKPIDDIEFMRFSDWVYQKYIWYLEILKRKIVVNSNEIIQNQNRYCAVQASNPRTFNVLKAKIGEETARYFMEQILFPKI